MSKLGFITRNGPLGSSLSNVLHKHYMGTPNVMNIDFLFSSWIVLWLIKYIFNLLIIRNRKNYCCNDDIVMCEYNYITMWYKWRQDYLQRCVGLKWLALFLHTKTISRFHWENSILVMYYFQTYENLIMVQNFLMAH